MWGNCVTESGPHVPVVIRSLTLARISSDRTKTAYMVDPSHFSFVLCVGGALHRQGAPDPQKGALIVGAPAPIHSLTHPHVSFTHLPMADTPLSAQVTI